MPKRNRHSKQSVEKTAWPRPVLGVLFERSLSHADKVVYPLLGIAQQGFPFIQIPYGRTDLVRNKMALHLLKSSFTHLIMLDVDHVHPTDIVHRLMHWFVKLPDLKVVGGLNFRRGEPYDPCAFIRGDDGKYYPMSEWPDGLVEVDALGTGCIAIAREAFETIPPPWFYNDYSKVMDDVWPGEDIGFAMECAKYGIKQYVDTTITSPHLIDAVVDRNSFDAFIADKGYQSTSLSEMKSGDTDIHEIDL